MTNLTLRYVHEFRDRHGKVRRYFRRPGFKRATLPGLPGSEEFMAAYQAALDGSSAPKLTVGSSRTIPGTIGDLVARYFGSRAFLSISPSTQRTYRGIIERLRREHGDKRVAKLERQHVMTMLSGRAETPTASNNFLRLLKMLMQFAIDEGMRPDNPVVGIKRIKVKGDGFHAWTEEEIARFEERHPVGTKARLALALLLYTAQRRGDVVGMGRQHIRNGVLHVQQQKTGIKLEIPLHPALAAIIEATPSEHLTFLTTEYGRAFTSNGFGNWFRERCNEAGLSECSAHGLRKAASRRLAEAGVSTLELGSITGHQTLREIERYTKSASRSHMAKSAMAKVISGTPNGKP
jgi:integrase